MDRVNAGSFDPPTIGHLWMTEQGDLLLWCRNFSKANSQAFSRTHSCQRIEVIPFRVEQPTVFKRANSQDARTDRAVSVDATRRALRHKGRTTFFS